MTENQHTYDMEDIVYAQTIHTSIVVYMNMLSRDLNKVGLIDAVIDRFGR